MELIPEWAPNIHPMIVHFPIALFILAIIMDVAGYFLPESWWDEKKNLILYGLSGIAGIGTYFSGKEAADSVFIEAEAQNLLTEHADWAEYTVWFIALYALVRIGLYVWDKSDIKPVRVGMTLLSFTGAVLLFQTSNRGAQMVYQYGVGVQKAEIENSTQDAHVSDHNETGDLAGVSSTESSSTFIKTDNGNWEWEIEKSAVSDLKNNFHWLEGSLEGLNAEALKTTSGSYALAFSGNNMNGFLVGHGSYDKVQVDYYVDISALDGKIMLTNNVIDESNFDFVSITSNGIVKQGRIANGEEEIFEEGTTDVSKIMFVRVVGNGTHFRNYVNKEMIVHGHGDAPKAGGVGLKVSGSGTIVLEKMSLTKL
ncbi:MAG: DUF2231 domain-containing protein [Balneola sp.]